MTEILLYKQITQETAEDYIRNHSWISEGSNYAVRLYTLGGDVQAAWGMWAKMNELKANGCRSTAKVDGMAASMGGFLLCAFDEREAIETSQIMLHRAILTQTDDQGNEIEYTSDDLLSCSSINADLKIRLKSIINDAKLKSIKGYGIDDLFNENKERINCYLSASQALEIGLITKIIPLSTANGQVHAKAVAEFNVNKQNFKLTIKSPKMTAEEYKVKFPEEYKKVEAEISKKIEATKKAEDDAKKAEDAKKAKASKKDDDEEDDDEDPEFTAELEKVNAKMKAVKEDDDLDADEKKAKLEKLKAKKAKLCDGRKEAKLISAGVVMALKTLGVAQIEGSAIPQLAQASAKQMASLSAENKTKIEAEVEEQKKIAEEIKSGKFKFNS